VEFSPQANLPTEKPPLVGKVSSDVLTFAGREVLLGQGNAFLQPLFSIF
jgi:hypothetical protein